MGKTMRAIGLMSGTSMDGIDVALIDTDGEESLQRGPSATFPYSAEVRGQLKAAIDEAKRLERRDDRPGVLSGVERHLTELHAYAVQRFLADRKLDAAAIDILGFHGQTVLHRSVVEKVFVKAEGTGEPGADPVLGKVRVTEDRRTLTVQLGDGALLARLTGIDVVYDLRAADCAAGGQGAPLAPVYHRALAARLPERPVVVLNIGGVANATWIGRDGALIAFDTGPGNALIDDFVRLRTGQPQDDEGRAGAAGKVDEDAVARVLAHPFFAKPPPKSLDRNAFRQWVVEEGRLASKSTEDGVATLTAITAAAVAQATKVLPRAPAGWLVAGGGTRNPTLMRMLAQRLAPVGIETAGAVGWSADALEAQAFGYLAVRTLKGLPLTFPTTTGVPRPLTGGVLARKSDGASVPPQA